MLSISVFEVLWFWVISIGLFFALTLTLAVLIAAWSLGPSRSVFKGDLKHKVAVKRRLRSGKRLRPFPYVVGLLLLDNGVQATLLHRQSHWLLNHHARPLAELLHAAAKFATHIDVSPHARLGPGLAFYHGGGAVIGKGCVAGARLTVCQGSTVVGDGIGDDVFVGAGAVILSTATIGDRVDVGALSLVKGAVPSDCRAVGIPATRFLPPTHPRTEMESRSAAQEG